MSIKETTYPEPGTIWLVKDQYHDSFGELIYSHREFIVMVINEQEVLNDKTFTRVQPISKEIEKRFTDDILIDDESILGYPFIIETWNEQPVLTNILERCIGEIPRFNELKGSEEETKLDSEFRKKEIRETGYLRQSVLSELAWGEQNTNTKSPVRRLMPIVSVAACIIGIILLIWQPNRLSNKQFYDEYAFAFPIEIEIEYDNIEPTRGEECLYEGFTNHECEILALAIKSYKNHDYFASLKLFENIKNLRTRDEKLFLHFAVSQLFSEQTEEAIFSLNQIKNASNPEIRDYALYYLSIAYAKAGKISDAKKNLKLLQESGSNNFNTSKMLNDLRWF